jgi:beta-N-acetylhexosaminidase
LSTKVRHQAGQMLIIGLKGTVLEADEAKFIVDNNIGGIILMPRNCVSPMQIHALCKSVQALQSQMPDKLPLFVSIDMEGGRVHRLKPPFTKWPALAEIGKLDSTSVAFKFAFAMSEEMKAVGINLDFAPCIDIFSNPANTVIGDRALGTTPDRVAKLGSALVRGYLKGGVIPCAKHFPGHGNTLLDSHLDLPVENKSLQELEAFELEPFKKVFRSKLDLVMVAHVKNPKLDPDWPASLSEITIKSILIDHLKFRGLVITDDLDMKALTLNYSKAEIAVRAIQAGCDILLYCNEPDSQKIAMDALELAVTQGTIQVSAIESSYKKILALKAEHLTSSAAFSEDHVSKIVGHPEHLRLAKAIVAGEVPADLLAQPT